MRVSVAVLLALSSSTYASVTAFLFPPQPSSSSRSRRINPRTATTTSTTSSSSTLLRVLQQEPVDEDYLVQTEDFRCASTSSHHSMSVEEEIQQQFLVDEMLLHQQHSTSSTHHPSLVDPSVPSTVVSSAPAAPDLSILGFVPPAGQKAWEHHHTATTRLVRQHKLQQRREALRQKRRKNWEEARIEREIREERQQAQQQKEEEINHQRSPFHNPMNFITNMMSRPQLVSSKSQWKRLVKHAEYIRTLHLRDLLQDAERCQTLYATHDGVYLDYSRQQVTLETMKFLFDLAETQQLKQKIDDMVKGEKINFTEKRAVLHTALRADKSQIGSIFVDGVDVVREVHQTLEQIKEFTDGVRNGSIRGYTGKRLRNIVSVGIGGSYLGPEFLHECLKTEPEGVNAALGYQLRFLSNVDPVDVERTCADLDPEETLVVVVSKTFTTAETMLNARTMRQWLWDFMGNDPDVVRHHMVACSSVSAIKNVEDFGIDPELCFFRFWDFVGGRYSVCSAAGAVPISLLYGFDVFEKFLSGARSIDEHFVSAPFHKNIPVLMGLLGVWNTSFLKYKARVTLPYAEALLKLPAHIQQLDMESNGKFMTKHGLEVDYSVGEIDFGEAGTNGQHSFYQLLHMGQTVPSDFIGFLQSQHDFCLDGESISSHDELMSNFFAQPDALANGKTAEEVRAEGDTPEELIPHKVFKGNRPSMSLLLPKLTAYACGQLLSIYEHRTAVQGFMWDLNSFDQYGVELGKKLAIDVKEKMLDSRRDGGSDYVEASNPATTRLLNYYLENSLNTCADEDGNAQTKVTRKTHVEHSNPPCCEQGDAEPQR